MTVLQTETSNGQVLYGKQSKLAVDNFGTNGRAVGDVPAFVRNYALVKASAARANGRLDVLGKSVAEAIEAACAEIAAGQHGAQFPTALVLGGGGTTTNMNFNEVIAARASQIAGNTIHPNDHVNASQSTNDTYPTAMALTIRELAEGPLAALNALVKAFEDKAAEYEATQRLGRTCLQDAVVLSVGQTHRSHATAIRRVTDGLRAATAELDSVPIGATVLGTGIGAPEGYRDLCVHELSQATGRQLTGAEDLVDALAHLDPYAAIASAGARAAITMAKIAADLRFLSSGPGGGISEVTLPAVQAGSSIMPGKINPVIPEFVMQLSYRIRGAAHTVECAVAAGELELNIMEPVIVDSILNIFEDLTASATTFARKCIKDLTWDGRLLHENINAGFDRWIAMAAEHGYDATTRAVNEARTGGTEATR
ncbi:lyase family protein [Arthrobacter cupressi]|uniref:Aspartate ammonia-lyase n=1 Tax=Arthrobacter cupressi TaxID=1045773 RepID=A0A1G8SRF3_9MICC|nr:lyase family protein [Arthrobacter cupressi]NYD78422.1 aspartate ammonia-lyase [Arthrobacter cupressi]SDJ31822.1 aspartate ammonia-lyase [Arthrobacter cupressi]